MKRQRVVKGQNPLGSDAHCRPRVIANTASVRNDRLHEIVATGELHHHQHRGFGAHCHRLVLLLQRSSSSAKLAGELDVRSTLHHANWYSFEATISCSRCPTCTALAWRSSRVSKCRAPPWRA